MGMVFHAIDNDRLLSFILDNAGNVLEYLIAPCFLQEILATLHCKDYLNINLRKCACHVSPPMNHVIPSGFVSYIPSG
jgi:hypothetical protein